MPRAAAMVDVFRYRDYREFLRDWYRAAKESRSSFSFRNFSKRAGFRSTNFFKLVMDGDRNLTEASLEKFVQGLRLNKQEEDFFRNLVLFTQSKNHDEKNRHYQRMLRSRKFSQLQPIEKQQYEYCSAWYHAVIRELVVSSEFDGTPEWLTRRIFPTITIGQAEQSIQLLEQLGFISKNGGDRWEQSSPLLSTGAEASSLALFNYHKNLFDLSKDILEHIDAADRDISAMTLGVVRDRIPLLKKKIQEFRQEILKYVADDDSPDEVVQLNIQFFPLTKSQGEQQP